MEALPFGDLEKDKWRGITISLWTVGRDVQPMDVGELRNLARSLSISRPSQFQTGLTWNVKIVKKLYFLYFLHHSWLKIFHLKAFLYHFKQNQNFSLIKLSLNKILNSSIKNYPIFKTDFYHVHGRLDVLDVASPTCMVQPPPTPHPKKRNPQAYKLLVFSFLRLVLLERRMDGATDGQTDRRTNKAWVR